MWRPLFSKSVLWINISYFVIFACFPLCTFLLKWNFKYNSTSIIYLFRNVVKIRFYLFFTIFRFCSFQCESVDGSCRNGSTSRRPRRTRNFGRHCSISVETKTLSLKFVLNLKFNFIRYSILDDWALFHFCQQKHFYFRLFYIWNCDFTIKVIWFRNT